MNRADLYRLHIADTCILPRAIPWWMRWAPVIRWSLVGALIALAAIHHG